MNFILQKPKEKKEVPTKRLIWASSLVILLTFFLQFQNSNLNEFFSKFTLLNFLGNFLLSVGFTSVMGMYLKINHKEIFYSDQKLSLLLSVCILSLTLSKAVEFGAFQNFPFLKNNMQFPLFVPYSGILICLLLGSELALFTSFFLIVFLGLSLDVTAARFCTLNALTTLVAILLAKNMHKQKEIFGICLKVWITAVMIITAFHFTENSATLNITEDFLFSFVFMLASAILVISLLPVLEFFFNVMTDMTLMEFADPSCALLRRLSLEAPGTYQHSLVVGNLAENAARAIHANGLFCRISTLYHDIGKLFNPHYFNENQFGGLNIHQLLTPKESAAVIIAHINEGETLAKKHRLPKSFVDIIKEHHGTTLIQYFYNKHQELMKDSTTSIDHNDFRYLGPKPCTKESAIIMIADKVEAASRSLKETTVESITQMVDTLVSERMQDGQLDECQLTFGELAIVKKEMVKTLVIARHLRVK